MIGQGSQQPAVPLDHRRHQFRDHERSLRGQHRERGRGGVAHAEPANQDAGVFRRLLTGQPHHRVLGAVHAAAHQLVAVSANDVVLIVTEQLQQAAVRRPRCRDPVPGLHVRSRSPPADEAAVDHARRRYLTAR